MKFLLAAIVLVGGVADASAQQQSVTSAFQGFSIRSDEPVNVEADNLEVRDQEQAATFSGNVQLKQGASTLSARRLTIFYFEKGKKPDAKPEQGARPTQGDTTGPEGGAKPESGRDIRRMEADGDVVVAARNQRATGAKGVFDVESNKVELSGGVVVAQGENVIRGERLKVDLTTQTSRIEGGGGRVQGVFRPRERDQQGASRR